MAKLINLIICTFSFLQTASSRQINAPLLDAFDYIGQTNFQSVVNVVS